MQHHVILLCFSLATLSGCSMECTDNVCPDGHICFCPGTATMMRKLMGEST